VGSSAEWVGNVCAICAQYVRNVRAAASRVWSVVYVINDGISNNRLADVSVQSEITRYFSCQE
jgi:hypothetical protein